MVVEVRCNVTDRLHNCAGEDMIVVRNSAARSDTTGIATPRRAFSVVELLIVLAIATALTAILMPVFSMVRESAQRVICASNERQIGMAMIMYADANRAHLPYSAFGEIEGFRQQDMMAAHRGGGDFTAWEGMGLLFQQHYCTSSSCFYCPSHTGQHTHDRYERWYQYPVTTEMIFTNYHYAGDFDRSEMESAVASGQTLANVDPPKKRLLDADTVLISDGMRTAADFNHHTGMNVLRGDGSVRWRDDRNTIYPLLPRDYTHVDNTDALYVNIWQLIIEQP